MDKIYCLGSPNSNSKPTLNLGYLTPEHILLATLQNNPLHFRITVCFKRVILKIHPGQVESQRKKKSGFRNQWQRLWEPFFASPLLTLLRLKKFYEHSPGSIYLTLHLVEHFSVTPHHN